MLSFAKGDTVAKAVANSEKFGVRLHSVAEYASGFVNRRIGVSPVALKRERRSSGSLLRPRYRSKWLREEQKENSQK